MNSDNMYSLKGKVIIVTGGTGILGGAFINGIVSAGGAVGNLGRNAKLANERADEINKAGGNALALIADVLKQDELIAAREKAMAHFGKIDGLVNAAGGNMPEGVVQPGDSVFHMNLEGLQQVMAFLFFISISAFI